MKQFLIMALLLVASPVWAYDFFYRFGTDQYDDPDAISGYVQVSYNSVSHKVKAEEYLYKYKKDGSGRGDWYLGETVNYDMTRGMAQFVKDLKKQGPSAELLTDRIEIGCGDDPKDMLTLIDYLYMKVNRSTAWMLIDGGRDNCYSRHYAEFADENLRSKATALKSQLKITAEKALYGFTDDWGEDPVDESMIVAQYSVTTNAYHTHMGLIQANIQITAGGTAKAYLTYPINQLDQLPADSAKLTYKMPEPDVEIFIGHDNLNKLMKLFANTTVDSVVQRPFMGACSLPVRDMAPYDHLYINMSSLDQPWLLVSMNLGCDYGHTVRYKDSNMARMAEELKDVLRNQVFQSTQFDYHAQ